MLTSWRQVLRGRRLVRERLAAFDDRYRVMLGGLAVQAQNAAKHLYRDLTDAEFSIYSQWGEDGILHYICDCLGLRKPRILEIGIGDFTECNSKFLAAVRCASVFAVDCLPNAKAVIEVSELAWRTTLVFEQVEINTDNARSIFKQAEERLGGIDIVSLDIDGLDYWVLREMPLDDVEVVVVEYNPTFGPHAKVTVPQGGSFSRFDAHWSGLFWGASLRAFVELLDDRGFRFVGTNRAGNNAFFISVGHMFGWQLDLPDTENLEQFTDWRVCDTPNATGGFLRLTQAERLELIGDLSVWNIESQEIETLSSLKP